MKCALLALLATFAVVVIGCNDPEDQTARTEQSEKGSESKDDDAGGKTGDEDSGSGDSETNQENDDDAEANMPDLFTMTAEACDEGIKVTVSYTELAGGEYVIEYGNIFENNSRLNLGYPSTLNESGTATFVFPFTESGKEYSFGIRGDYYGTAYNGYFTKTLVTCVAKTTTAEGSWYASNKEYFTGYNVDCNFDGSKITVTRDFPTVKDMDESSALAKIKEMKESVLNFTGSKIEKVKKNLYQFVYGYVDYYPKADWKGAGSQELTGDDIALTETAELDSWCYYEYKYSLETFINNGYDGRYAGSYAYQITVGSDVWITFENWSDQKYYYVVGTTNTVPLTTKETSRVLHAVYDSTYEKYIVNSEEHKTVASGTSFNDLALSDTILTATAMVEGEDYVAVLYNFENDSLYLRACWGGYSESDGASTALYTSYMYLYSENGKLYYQMYKWVEKTYTDTSKEKETYWEKDGEPTECSFKDGKIVVAGLTFTMGKVDDTYFMYWDDSKCSRISGSGLYSTFEWWDNNYKVTFTFKEDGTLTMERSYQNSDGSMEYHTDTDTYKNRDGLISVYYNGEISSYIFYDGLAIYQSVVFEEVSELPTVTETIE